MTESCPGSTQQSTAYMRLVGLALNATAAVTARKRFHFLAGNKVEVAGDGVLQSRSRNAEFQSRLKVFAVEEAANNAARKAVAAAYAVRSEERRVGKECL